MAKFKCSNCNYALDFGGNYSECLEAIKTLGWWYDNTKQEWLCDLCGRIPKIKSGQAFTPSSGWKDGYVVPTTEPPAVEKWDWSSWEAEQKQGYKKEFDRIKASVTPFHM